MAENMNPKDPAGDESAHDNKKDDINNTGNKPQEVMSPKEHPDSASSQKDQDEYKSVKSSDSEHYKKLEKEIQELKELLKNQKNPLDETIKEGEKRQPSYHSMASGEEDGISVSPSEGFGAASQISASSQMMEAIQNQNDAISKTLTILKNQDKVKPEKLPHLDISDQEMRTINLVTWMKSSAQKVGNMGVMAKKFWKMLEEIVIETYDIYMATEHMLRSTITPKTIDDPEYENIRDVMGTMIHEAVNKEVRNHMVSLSIMEPEVSLFHIYKRCAPGGPEERKVLLEKVRVPVKKMKKEDGIIR